MIRYLLFVIRKLVTLYVSEKRPFANNIEQFWKKIHEERNVKIANCLRALARVERYASLRVCDLVERFMNPKMAHRREQNQAFFKKLNSYENCY